MADNNVAPPPANLPTGGENQPPRQNQPPRPPFDASQGRPMASSRPSSAMQSQNAPRPPQQQVPPLMNQNRPPQQPPQAPKPPVAPPPPKEVGIRTMQGDVSSISRGEAMPKPETVMPKPMTMPRPEEKRMETKPEAMAHFQDSIVEEEDLGGGTSGGRWVWMIVSFVVFVGLGLAGYYFVFPLIFPETTTPAPVTQQPVTQQPVTPRHQSFFIFSPNDTKTLALSSYSVADIANALKGEVTVPLPFGQMKEIVLEVGGEMAMFANVINALAPSVSMVDAERWFRDDFTAFLHYNQDGVWPGYIAQMAVGANREEVESMLARLETSDLTNFYVAPAGQASGFRDGSVFGIYPTRYATFQQKGAAFNYAVIDNFILFSTSYTGLQEAVRLMGFPTVK